MRSTVRISCNSEPCQLTDRKDHRHIRADVEERGQSLQHEPQTERLEPFSALHAAVFFDLATPPQFGYRQDAPSTGLAKTTKACRHPMPSIGLLSNSVIVDDPRIRRQGDAFALAGWQVWAIGLPGGRSGATDWPILDGSQAASDTAPSAGSIPLSGFDRAQRLWKRALPHALHPVARPLLGLAWRGVAASRSLRARSSLENALALYWKNRQFVQIYERARSIRPDIWLANDWNMLPVAARLAEETGTIFGYDSHEFATSEYEERASWRLLHKPMISLIEGHFIRKASCVSTVSSGISEALFALYELREKPLTIFNSPALDVAPLRPTKEPARVLYHGVVSPGRGLEASIESVPSWRDGRTLTIRGPAQPEYRIHLEKLIAKHRLEERVTLAPPVAMLDLIKSAREFDIGLLALPSHSLHNSFALPNKFFEYAMAGLSLCMSELPEMARLIRQHDMGVTIAETTPKGIAAALNAFDIDAIDRCKRNALEAARLLSWDEVGKHLVDQYSQALARTTGSGPSSRLGSR
jgi:hypothetical protein